MEVFPLVDEHTVLRVPRRTEQQLIDEFGSCGRKALATGHEVSISTERELHDLEAIESYIGAFVPDTTPFADLDLNGEFRYYSLQRRVTISADLRNVRSKMPAYHSRRSLERFIRDVRDMFDSLRILPDLAGPGNLVLDRFGLVKLIDINNFRRLVSNEELEGAIPDDETLTLLINGQRDLLPAGFIDDIGLPIADLSLAHLRNLEIRALGRAVNKIDADEFYRPLFHQRRQQVLATLKGDSV
ncbi:MAG: hypothetical protein H6707_02310 [Deltaproteobacteria bacterium]|nr:hypothetical protein [Deltaproteobacteria bacterium]